jgi:transcriptional regulator with XRE-family HTH domain
MTPWYEKARQILTERKMSIRALSDRLGLTPGAVGHYLRGRRQPTPGMLRKIAAELQVSVSELIEDDPTFARDDTEHQALELLRRLPRERRSAALAMLRGLTGEDPNDDPSNDPASRP